MDFVRFVFVGEGIAYAYEDAESVLDEDVQLIGTEVADLHTERASSVEPVRGQWIADMDLSEGPILGPYRLRKEALAAERVWLHNKFEI